MQEGHPGPKGLKVFQKDPVTLGWGLGPHQGGCRFLQGPSGNDIGHKTRTGQAHQDTGEDDPGIGLDFQGIDNGSSGIGIANKGGDKEIPQDGTKNSSHNGCQKSIEVKFLGDLISLEAQGLKGSHIVSMLFHHPGHGGEAHQHGDGKEKEGKEFHQGVHTVGIAHVVENSRVGQAAVDGVHGPFQESHQVLGIPDVHFRLVKVFLGLLGLFIIVPLAFF